MADTCDNTPVQCLLCLSKAFWEFALEVKPRTVSEIETTEANWMARTRDCKESPKRGALVSRCNREWETMTSDRSGKPRSNAWAP